MLINEGIIELIRSIESKEPTPGGGSVSAIVGALGSSLALMYQNLSFEKPSYLELDKEIRDIFKAVFDKLLVIQEKLLELSQKDADAYDSVVSAYRLPKESEEDIEVRKAEIEKATILATETPLAIMRTACDGLKLIAEIVGYGNKNAISDAGVAAILLTAACEGAALNVKINIPILDSDKQNGYLEELKKLSDSSAIFKKSIIETVNEKM